VAVGQGAGKSAWPKRSGGFQAITGRRYARRYAYLGFRAVLNSQDRDACQYNEVCAQLELENVQNRNCISFSASFSPLVQVSPGLLDEPWSENAESGELVCQSILSRTFEATTSSLSVFCYGLEGNQISWNFMNPSENSEDLAEDMSGERNDVSGTNGSALVNIDSYEPDSRDGEEDDGQDRYSWLRRTAGLTQGRLDNMLPQCGKEVESLTGLRSGLSALDQSVCRESSDEAGPMCLVCPNNRTFKSAEDQALTKHNLSSANYETQQVKQTVDIGIGNSVPISDVLTVNSEKTGQENSSELVVRPKIRKQNNTNQWEGEERLPDNDDKELGCWTRVKLADTQPCHPKCPFAVSENKEEMTSDVFFLSSVYSHQNDTEIDQKEGAAAQEQEDDRDDSALSDLLEDLKNRYLMCLNDRD
ncbi:PREDICTED: E3 ubiquitin-protein ligase Praja-2, partial [Acanthisitta chloris]|uniref:E3 ubiquitin-protein ligase Praja-2 n=1 Tax=Acanthisitta chloris TaxID=57068 RepID=UPI0004F0CFED